MTRSSVDIAALYAAHGEKVLLFLVRRTTDTEVALDLWAETFAQAVAGRHRFRGGSDEEAAGWLYAIARGQLSRYYRRGRAERRALDRLRLQRPPADALVEAELARRAGLHELRCELAAALAELSEETRQAIELRVIASCPIRPWPSGWRSANRRRAPASRAACAPSATCSTSTSSPRPRAHDRRSTETLPR